MKQADIADPDAEEEASDVEDSDSEDQTVVLLQPPDARPNLTSSACTTRLPFAMFLVSNSADQLSVIPAGDVPGPVPLSFSTNQMKSVISGIAILSYSSQLISLSIPTCCASPVHDYRSSISTVGIPIKICFNLFLSPLPFLQTPPSTLLLLPSFVSFPMHRSAPPSQYCQCMVAAGSSPAHKFLALVNSSSDVTCFIRKKGICHSGIYSHYDSYD
jgi:hypothetical protein